MRSFKTIAWVEGISLLMLLFVAMPAKYYAGFPLAVSIAGWLHGVLFVVYTVVVAKTAQQQSWSTRRYYLAMLAGIAPFGFLFSSKLIGEKRSEDSPSSSP
jgi:integral membrane protein